MVDARPWYCLKIPTARWSAVVAGVNLVASSQDERI